jgi:hypothetical protein
MHILRAVAVAETIGVVIMQTPTVPASGKHLGRDVVPVAEPLGGGVTVDAEDV